ncbi:MAG: CBS domain-containing protein, partial [Pseudomonadota bacterium]|nr:CBS domain-containing protein [Pseudomonadota bacterium]
LTLGLAVAGTDARSAVTGECLDALRNADLEAKSIRSDIIAMTEGRLGLALVGTADALTGILTDGDLRRLLMRGVDLASTPVSELASPSPLTIAGDLLMADAEARMQESRVQCLVVTGENGHVEGVVQIFE